ncbi:putative phytoene synthase [Trypanosoma rangeli]|uniref:Putative phytoene synthase n=1 Tax=Trypanosoma rangeli TaxID=5698 RepID=A0A422N197_TRYRA|nr:putative phytoene synthase [Trypanosoma rangeli]RNE99246.1 putative phytoene synthase [Trypanosoma rangeli]|eukprot:RNE99246.1 putative phytoene synthase [Trypanosoma rangeli]
MANVAFHGKLSSTREFQVERVSSLSSLPQRLPSTVKAAASRKDHAAESAGAAGDARINVQEAEDYYRSVPRNALSKEEMRRRIASVSADKADRVTSALQASEADYLKMEEDMKESDLFHYRMGEIAYPAAGTQRSYYAMWQLAMPLNNARWTMLDVLSQHSVKTTGAGMKLLFWKESVNQIMGRRQIAVGQFTDSHPVLRPFAAVVEQSPQITRAFVRGFTDAQLRVLQQPGNVKQLFDHFDRYYGYFVNALLEVTHVKDEGAADVLQHMLRAIGLTQHCVMFWKKYANIGLMMLPTDLCADNHVNIALLKNILLAARDRAVWRLLYDVMCIAKTEMLHTQHLAPVCTPTA